MMGMDQIQAKRHMSFGRGYKANFVVVGSGGGGCFNSVIVFLLPFFVVSTTIK